MDCRRMEQLYVEHRAACCRIASDLLDDDDAAVDVVHDVFVKLPEDFFARVPKRKRPAYLRKAVRNQVLMELRHRRRELTTELEQDLPAVGPSPEDVASRAHHRLLLVRALGRLPVRCGKVMAMLLQSGMTRREIAKQLGTSIKAVEKQITRGYGHLSRMREVALLRSTETSTFSDGGGVGHLVRLTG
jgi:RNA polymerase sigma factor (sigma-70 family)